MNKLFYVEELQELIETVMFTACIREEKPTSIILVGPSGIGKSVLLGSYKSPALRPTDSVSSQGLFDIAKKDEKNTLKFLLIPDMNPTLSRKASTVQSTMANLLSFTADGTVRVDDGREGKECKHEAVGIITAATDDIYHGQSKKWFALGLRRRIIPLFFKYSFSTTCKLQAQVRRDRIHSTPPPKKDINLSKVARPVISDQMQREIEILSQKLAGLLGKLNYRDEGVKKWFVRNVVPISPQITLQNLARAHAMREGRATVQKKDFEFLLRFIGYCDPETPREI